MKWTDVYKHLPRWLSNSPKLSRSPICDNLAPVGAWNHWLGKATSDKQYYGYFLAIPPPYGPYPTGESHLQLNPALRQVQTHIVMG